MNPNIPYGQHMPVQMPQRRHDIPYGQLPPHMRPQPPYQQFFQQPMSPMMPHYPHYQQQWYPHQPYYGPPPGGRPQYYPQYPPSHMMPQPQIQQHPGGPLIVSSQANPSASPRYVPAPSSPYPLPGQQNPNGGSVASIQHAHTPPSPSISAAGDTGTRKEPTPPTTPMTTAIRESLPSSSEGIPAQTSFVPPVPWLSVQDEPFPPKARRQRKQILRSQRAFGPVTFPIEDEIHTTLPPESATAGGNETHLIQQHVESSAPTPTQTPTPLPSDAPSDTISTQPTTPSSTITASNPKSNNTPGSARPIRAPVPIVPVVPVLPHSNVISQTRRESTTSSTTTKSQEPAVNASIPATEVTAAELGVDAAVPIPAAPQPAPSSWAALLRSKNNTSATFSSGVSSSVANGLITSKGESLGDVLGEISVSENPTKVAFLQPRGLVNTGNMCYMNSVLQMLVFCTPFYEFLDRVARRAPHTFKSDTPLLDAMIMFMKEYPTIDSTTSVDQLRLRLKPEDYEHYGEPFIPEYVYNVIRELPRFRDMRRGHQQDAQEFLGFLLEELHEECVRAMRSGSSTNSGTSTPMGSSSNISDKADVEGEWMEVGHKQKASVMRSSGTSSTESPVTSTFGGKLRSELKIPGDKMRVMLEAYQPLQLDIGSHQVNNIVDALKGLTKPESMQGDFESTRGTRATATKQVFIDTLPPVLILHLKRFHYDANTKRAEKIWKKVGYPLDLEIPKEVFPTSARNKYSVHGGLPKYRLIGVIYHHGKNANGGHYTVDIRRQDGKEWIRVDDTVIRRVKSEEVAEGGSEEDPKILAAALERHRQQAKNTANRFEQIDGDEQDDEISKQVWSQVNGHSRAKSSVGALVNGTATPSNDSPGPQTPRERFSVKDNKVAYLLFYQRLST